MSVWMKQIKSMHFSCTIVSNHKLAISMIAWQIYTLLCNAQFGRIVQTKIYTLNYRVHWNL